VNCPLNKPKINCSTTCTTGYRFSFNGQEKTDEISGEGNHNTAMFWEYDTRLGRRWNLDPKPQVNISDYAAFANNPIRFIDPLGDVVKVRYKGTDLTYNSGKYYNADGSSYSGKGVRKDGTYKRFLGQTASALGNISNGSEGKAAVDELVASTSVFTIKHGSENSFTPTSSTKAGANIPEVQAVTGNTQGSSGVGGVIVWNPNSTESGFNTAGTRDRPSYIGLAHEMFHGRDANQGVLHFDNDYTNPLTRATYYANDAALKKSEWRAVYFENVLRGQLGLHLRTHYGVKETSPGSFAPDGPKLIDNSGNPVNYLIK
jgi:hypothetical protein